MRKRFHTCFFFVKQKSMNFVKIVEKIGPKMVAKGMESFGMSFR